MNGLYLGTFAVFLDSQWLGALLLQKGRHGSQAEIKKEVFLMIVARCFLSLFLLKPVGVNWVPQASAQSSTTESPKPELRDDFVWRDRAHQRALFVPGSAIESSGTIATPLSEGARLRIRREVSRRSGAAGPPKCYPPVIGDSGPSIESFYSREAKPRPSVAEFLTAFDVSFIARVARTVPGWLEDSFGGYVATLVWVDVEEVLNDKRGDLRPGARVSYIQRSGTLSIGGAVFCTDRPGYTKVIPGDRVVVIGSYDEANPQHTISGDESVLPVVNGVAKAVHSNRLGRDEIPLDEMRSALKDRRRDLR